MASKQSGFWLVLAGVLTVSFAKYQLAVERAQQCYGRPIPVVCEAGYMVRVVRAQYTQSVHCSPSPHSHLCARDEPGNPACVGNRTCIFTTPWIYLSAQCGYSNSFEITYQCVPTGIQNNICSSATLEAASAFLLSPNYPLKYPPQQKCSTVVRVSPGHQIHFYLLDVYLAYYKFNTGRQCVDGLSIVDPHSQHKTPPICTGQQRQLVFTTSSNEAVVFFSSGEHSSKAKGFWLYYEAAVIPASTGQSSTVVPVNTTPSEQESTSTLAAQPTTPAFSTRTKLPLNTTVLNSTPLKPGPASVTASPTPGIKTDSTTVNPLRDKGFVDLLFLQDKTPWYLKYATKLGSTTPMLAHTAVRARGGHSLHPKPSRSHTGSSTPPLIKHPEQSTTMKVPGPKLTRLPRLHAQSISKSLPRVPMVLDADHPSLISDVLLDRRPTSVSPQPTPPSYTSTTLPEEGSPAPHSQPSNLHSPGHTGLLLGLTVPEIGAIAGGGACFVGLTVAIIVTIAMHKRQRRKLLAHHKNVRAKKPFNDVILAYESNDGPPSNGVNNMGFTGVKSDGEHGEYPTGRDGKVNGTWKSWNTGLVPIDETIEDLYTEVKRCDLDPERARHKAKFIKGRSRSKSLDDLLMRSRLGYGGNKGAELLPMSLSLDSLDCSIHSHSNLTNVTGSCYEPDSDLDPEFYERLDEMYSDVALAHVRARAQQYEQLQQQLEALSTPVTPVSGSPYVRLHRSPALSRGLHSSPIHTPFEMSLLDHEDVDIAL